jgi:hypothetical protein
MLSVWWVLEGFLGGGSAGVFIIALMQATLPKHSARDHHPDGFSQ